MKTTIYLPAPTNVAAFVRKRAAIRTMTFSLIQSLVFTLLLFLAPAFLNASPACCPDGDAFLPQNRAFSEDASVRLSPEAARNIGVVSTIAHTGTLPETQSALGRLAIIPEHEAVVSSRVAGRIVRILAREGDPVQSGQILFTVETRQPGSPPPSVDITAPLDGILHRLNVRLGQPIEPDTIIAEIRDFTELYAIADMVGERVRHLTPGTSARVTTEAFPDHPADAVFERLDSKANPTANTTPAIFRLSNTTGQLRPGMRALFNIFTSPGSEGLLVERSAIQGEHGNYFVYAADATDSYVYHKVPIVLLGRNADHAMVEGELQPGDAVVTHGAYAMRFAGAVARAQIQEAAEASHGHSHGPGEEDHDEDEHTDDGHDHETADHDNHNTAEHEHNDFLTYTLGGSTVLLLGLLILQSVRYNRRRKE